MGTGSYASILPHTMPLACLPPPHSRFRNDVVVETVKLKHGHDAGQAIAGLLLANARFEQTVGWRIGDLSRGAGRWLAGSGNAACRPRPHV